MGTNTFIIQDLVRYAGEFGVGVDGGLAEVFWWADRCILRAARSCYADKNQEGNF